MGRRRLGRSVAAAEATWAGRIVPAWLLHLEWVLRPDGRRADSDPEVGERIMSVGLDEQRQLLPALRALITEQTMSLYKLLQLTALFYVGWVLIVFLSTDRLHSEGEQK
jgi:hypothetical protein